MPLLPYVHYKQHFLQSFSRQKLIAFVLRGTPVYACVIWDHTIADWDAQNTLPFGAELDVSYPGDDHVSLHPDYTLGDWNAASL